MKKSFLLFLSLFFLLRVDVSKAQILQSIKIVDSLQNPIVGVLAFNRDKSLVYTSNQFGLIPNAAFQANDSIVFQHPTYQSQSFLFLDLSKNNYTIVLKINTLDLGEVVVSANKWEQNPREVPLKISRISSEEIALGNPQTAADLLGLSNEVFIQKSQLGGGSPMIRGFSTSSVLLVIDGVRMNNAIFRGGNVQNVISLDASSIERTEILFGPGSVIYGSDALGGVMDFHTLSPQLSPNQTLLAKGNAMLRYSSANHEKTAHVDLNLAKHKWSFLSSLSFSDYDDLRMGKRGRAEYQRQEYAERVNGQDQIIPNEQAHIQRFSGFSQFNFLQKIRFQPNPRLDLRYAYHYSRSSNVPRYDRLIERRNGDLRFAEWYYGPQKWQMHHFQAKYIHKNPLFDQAKLTLAYQDYEESRHDRRFNNPNLRNRSEGVNIFSINLDFDRDIKQNATLFYGLEAIYNEVSSRGYIQNIDNGSTELSSSRYPDGSKYFSYASYLSYKNNLSRDFTLSLGLRYNYVGTRANFENNAPFFDFPFEESRLNNHAVSASLGLVYRPDDLWQISLNLSSGFRAPNIDDVGKVFDSEPGSVVVPNPDLSPEYAYNIDLNISKHWKNGSRLQFSPFFTWAQDLMVRRNFSFNGQDSIFYDGELSRSQALVNANTAWIAGFSTSLDLVFHPIWQLKQQFTLTRGGTENGESLRHVAPVFGSTHLIFKKQGWTVDLYANYNGEIPFARLAPSERGKPDIYAQDSQGLPFAPAWYTINLKASFQIFSYLGLHIGLENITNERYRPYSSGIVAPGRNLIISIRSAF